MPSILKSGAAAIALAFAAGCAGTPAPAPETAVVSVDYAAIVDTPDRPDADILSDPLRKPAEVLALFSPRPGDTILEIEAGGGYYTELLSRITGPGGKVYMQNPAGFDAFIGEAVKARLARLSNVTYLKSDFDAFDVPDASIDIATWFQGPHEIWYTPDGAAAALGHPDKSFRDIARTLKPGGRFVVIDHVAPAGAPPTTGGDTHRIDPAHILAMAEAAGFVLETESALLRNPADDGLANVFDPAIRGRTSQAILIFRKP